MSNKANPTAIGAFVLGALVILAAAILIFGGGQFLVPTHKYTLFFGTSVKGLRVGAPVSFRGDKVGEVITIHPLVNAETSDIDIKVVIEIPDDDGVQIRGEGALAELWADDERVMEYLVKEKGMRAKLSLQSLVTGQLFVDLDFHPEEPPRLKDIPTRYPQLPTIETGIQQLMKSLQELPIRETIQKIRRAVDAFTDLATSPKLPETLDNIHAAAEEARKLAANLNGRVDQLSEDWLATSSAARSALVQAQKTFALEEGRPAEVATTFIATSDAVSAAMKSANDAATAVKNASESIDSLIAEGTPIRAELERLITELAAAARSIRLFSDYLERHPEALIKGKQ